MVHFELLFFQQLVTYYPSIHHLLLLRYEMRRAVICKGWHQSPMEETLLAPGLWPSLAWPPCGSLIPWLPIKRAHFQNCRIKTSRHTLSIFHYAFFLCCLELRLMQQTEEERSRGWGWELCSIWFPQLRVTEPIAWQWAG